MSRNDHTILRELAERVAEIAALLEQDQKREMWADKGGLKYEGRRLCG